VPSRRTHALAAVKAAAANHDLRRIGTVYALSATAEKSTWVTLLVYAYARFGLDGSVLVALVQLVPSALAGPFIGAATDRRSPRNVLLGCFLAQTAAAGVLTALAAFGAAPAILFAAAPLSAIAFSAIRPAQAALQPEMAHSPEELSAASVTTGWLEGVATVAGPALAGVFIAWHGVAASLGVSAAIALGCAALVASAVRPATARGRREARAARAARVVRVARAAPMPGTVGAPERSRLASRAAANMSGALRATSTRVILVLQFLNYLVVGTLDLVAVVLAVSVLHIGQSGAGYLSAARGAGAMLAGLVSLTLLSRSRLTGPIASSILVAGAGLAVLGSAPHVATAFALIAVIGLAGAVFKMSGRTLYLRVAPPGALAGAFSLLETQRAIGLAFGALLVRAAVPNGGARTALVATAGVLLLLIAAFWRSIRTIDSTATVPHVELQLLRNLPIFSSLPPPELEGVARQLVRAAVPAGTEVIRQGDPGDRYYIVGEGTLEYVRDGTVVGTAERGDGFGELALLRNAPRAVSVVARSDCTLYSLEKEPFVLLLTGYPAARSMADEVVAGYLATEHG
jgi:MFS family permease